jgi:hypothetical protein
VRHDDPTDNTKRYFRAGERVFLQNGAWYFAAREGDQGPYPTRDRALVEMQRFIRVHTELKEFSFGLAQARTDAVRDQGVPSAEPVVEAPKAQASGTRFELEPMTLPPAQYRR